MKSDFIEKYSFYFFSILGLIEFLYGWFGNNKVFFYMGAFVIMFGFYLDLAFENSRLIKELKSFGVKTFK